MKTNITIFAIIASLSLLAAAREKKQQAKKSPAPPEPGFFLSSVRADI
jgi:hypothetical protein